MATRTVLSRDAARNLREGVYTDGELQGVILELAEVQARLYKNFKWVIFILKQARCRILVCPLITWWLGRCTAYSALLHSFPLYDAGQTGFPA